MRLLSLAALALAAACAAGPAPVPRDAEIHLADDVSVRRIAPGLWMHVTSDTIGGGAVYPANGMLLETDSGGILVDTGWNDRQAEVLLRWARGIGQPVRLAIVTHAHRDRNGGVGAVRRAGVPVRGHRLTGELSLREGVAGVDSLAGLDLRPVLAGTGAEVYFPGAGHAPDNVVVYFPRQRVLYGGCLVKADTATTVGNVADADVPGWPAAVARVRDRYPAARQVVPGHGAVSGPAALSVTERVIRERGPAALDAFRRSRGGTR